MLESILLIIFFIIGGLAALLALFFFIVAIVRHSKSMFKIGLAITIVPLFLFGVIFWYYDIHIPILNWQIEKSYAGKYVMIPEGDPYHPSYIYGSNPRLILNRDGSFHLDSNHFSRFSGRGTWRSGATDDGQFEFRDNRNAIVFRANPSNNNKLEIVNHNGGQKLVFVK